MINTSKSILVIDDEPEFRVLIYKKLRPVGYPVILAQNGEEALVALWENQSIKLVLLDVHLPFINGLNIFEIIKKDFPDKKVIVTSVLQKEEQQFLINEADDYYHKGEVLDSLLEKVNNVFSNKSTVGTLKENEKRNFRRVPVNVLASCENINNVLIPPSKHFFSYTKDLSLKGGRFVVSEDIKVGEHFSAALELPVNFLPLLIDCEVVWAKKLEKIDSSAKGSIEVGARFVKLDSARDEEQLKNYFNYV